MKLDTIQTVLVVEDHPQVRATVDGVLRRLGYKVILASNGTEAIAICQADQCIDLLFTDMLMAGGLNGIDVANRALQLRPQLRVRLTSAYADDFTTMWQIAGSRSPLLRKPYAVSVPSGRLSELLAR